MTSSVGTRGGWTRLGLPPKRLLRRPGILSSLCEGEGGVVEVVTVEDLEISQGWTEPKGGSKFGSNPGGRTRRALYGSIIPPIVACWTGARGLTLTPRQQRPVSLFSHAVGSLTPRLVHLAQSSVLLLCAMEDSGDLIQPCQHLARSPSSSSPPFVAAAWNNRLGAILGVIRRQP